MSRGRQCLVILGACVFCLWFPPRARAQRASPGPDVTISSVHPLTDASPPFPVVETYLAVNPRDPDNLLATAMSTSASQALVYGSWDGGRTWRQVEGPTGPVFPGGDPMLTFDGNGRAYFATIARGISVWRSGDGGRTWNGPAVAGPELAADRDWVAASSAADSATLPVLAVAKAPVPTLTRGRRDVFVISVSSDGGATFPAPTLFPPDSGYLNSVTDLVVRPDGTALMPYLVNYGRIPGPEQLIRGRRWIRISKDAGSTWSGAYLVAANLQYGNENWDRAMKGLGGGDLAVDESNGPHRGTLYLTWAAVLDHRLQIVVARSTDGGRTWEEPVRVNDGGFDADHGTPALAVNRDGILAVTWNDRRQDPDQLCFRHYVAVSTDGGRTFGTNRPVGEAETCPGARSRWLNGGDTQGLAALADGSFRSVWTVGEPESLRPWTAVIRVQ